MSIYLQPRPKSLLNGPFTVNLFISVLIHLLTNPYIDCIKYIMQQSLSYLESI